MIYKILFADSTVQTFRTPEEREACMRRLKANGLYLGEDYTLAEVHDDTNRKENTMKLKDFKPVIYSLTGDFQFVIIWDSRTGQDIAAGCSYEYAVKHYGDLYVKRISADGNNLVFTV